jgi:hypothetical protein
MIENLLNSNYFIELLNALAENEEYNYSNNGLNFSAKTSDGKILIEITYNDEVTDFKKFLDGLDDEIFIEVCESLGKEAVTKIHKSLTSNNLELIRENINRFKTELKKVLNNKINFYTRCLDNLTK